MRNRLLASGLIASSLVASLAFAAPASADESMEVMPALPAPDQVVEETHWYGRTTLAMDGAAVALMLVGPLGDGSPTSEALAYSGLSLYLAGGPVVHLANGHYGLALGSAVLRVGLPITLARLGMALAEPCSSSDEICLNGLGEGAAGLVVGVIGAIIIDDVVLGRDTRVVRHASTWGPTIAPSANGGMSFGFAGTF